MKTREEIEQRMEMLREIMDETAREINSTTSSKHREFLGIQEALAESDLKVLAWVLE